MHFGKALMISTHFDDVPLSLGGILHKKEIFTDISVLTVFTKSSYTILSGINDSANYISKLRILEMKKYCHEMNIKLYTLRFEDTTQRKYPEKDNVFDDIKFELNSKVNEIEYNTIFFPLGIGNHLDHLIVYKVAKNLSTTNKQVFFYEDLPYAANYEMEYIEWIINKRLNLPNSIKLDITGEINSKIKQLRNFRSQLSQKDFEFVYYHSSRLSLLMDHNYERIWYEGDKKC